MIRVWTEKPYACADRDPSVMDAPSAAVARAAQATARRRDMRRRYRGAARARKARRAFARSPRSVQASAADGDGVDDQAGASAGRADPDLATRAHLHGAVEDGGRGRAR